MATQPTTATTTTPTKTANLNSNIDPNLATKATNALKPQLGGSRTGTLGPVNTNWSTAGIKPLPTPEGVTAGASPFQQSGSITPPVINAPPIQEFNAGSVNDVYGEQNVVASAQGGPGQAPDYDNMLGIRNSIRDELGVSQAQQEYQDLRKQLEDYQMNTKEAVDMYGDKQVGLNEIRGLQSKIRRDSARGEENLLRNLGLAQENLMALKSEADTQFGIRRDEINEKKDLMLQFRGAGISFADSFDTAINKATQYEKQQKDQERLFSLKTQYPELAGSIQDGMSFDDAISTIGEGLGKKRLSEQYTSLLGYPPKDDMSSSKMRKDMKKYIKKQKDLEDEQLEFEMEMRKMDLEGKKLSLEGQRISNSKARSGGSGGSSSKDDKAFEKEAYGLADSVMKGYMDREYAVQLMQNRYPGYDPGVIYDLVPDGFEKQGGYQDRSQELGF